MEGLGFFYLDAISTISCGIYLRFDHKYFHNKFFFFLPSFHSLMATSTFRIIFFFLLPSFHSPWIIVTIINYIDNKRNSIAIHFLCVVISIVSGRGGFIFSCYHNHNNGRFGFFFFVAIGIIGGGIYLYFFSRCNDEVSQPHFGLSVRMKLTLPKVGIRSPPRLPQLQSSTAEGKNTSP